MDILKNSKLLYQIADEHIQSLISISSKVLYKKGEYLLSEGSFSDDFFIIISGTVELLKKDTQTSRPILIGNLGRGEPIGEMRVIQNRPVSLTIKASEPVVVLRTSITQLRSSEYHHCYNVILESIINIINSRLFNSNESIVKKIDEKKKKTRQLLLALCGIVVLGLFLAESIFAIYYAINPAYFCNESRAAHAHYPDLPHT